MRIIFLQKIEKLGTTLIVVANLSALSIIEPPVEADIVVGDIQPLGIPMSFGGPHAGFMACKETYMRQLPGRLVGQTLDADGKTASAKWRQTAFCNDSGWQIFFQTKWQSRRIQRSVLQQRSGGRRRCFAG